MTTLEWQSSCAQNDEGTALEMTTNRSKSQSETTFQGESLDSASTRPQFFRKVAELVYIGILTEIIYVGYVIALPLIQNTQGAKRIYDLEKLTQDNQWMAGVYFAGMVALFFLFWWAIQAVKEASHVSDTPSRKRALKLVILVFGLIFGFTLVWLYPISANDLFRYVLRGRIWAVYGASPMLHPPNDFPNDPYILFAGEFGDWVSGYGPLWEILVQVPMRLGATDIVSGAISLKFVALLFYFISVVLIGWVAWPGGQVDGKKRWTPLTGLLLFAWNPMVLVEGMGNGHNDLVLLALIVAGVILWERRLWWATAAALSLAAMTKATGLLMLPVFGVVLLQSDPTWRRRIFKGIAIVCIFLVLAYLSYRAVGPIEDTIRGVRDMLTTRRGFAIASSLRVILREVIPRHIAEPIPRMAGQYLFLLFYAGLLWQIWRGKLNLAAAAFLAYFAQLMYGSTFRVWYPIWLIPLAALYPVPAMYWRMLLFSFAGEMYVLNTFLWRWWLSHWEWGLKGPLGAYWQSWTVINALAVPWFMIPLFGPMVIRWWKK